jgi:uncharacterized protein YndB with AHSA1/START domain
MKIAKYTGITIIALLLLFFSLGFIKPSFDYTSSVTILTSPEKCWYALHDTVGMRRWMPGFEKFTLKSGTHLQPGASYEIIIQQDEKYVMLETIKVIRPAEYISYELINDVMKLDYSYTLTPKGNATEITNENRAIGTNLIWRSILFLSKSHLQTESQNQLDLLKLDIETKDVEFD